MTNPRPLKPTEVILIIYVLMKEGIKGIEMVVPNDENAFNGLSHDKPHYEITIDASLLSWGAILNGISTGDIGCMTSLYII